MTAVALDTYGVGDPKSETGIFIQDALDNVREHARLDLEPVLSPALLPPPSLPRVSVEPLPMSPTTPISEIVAKPLASGVRPIVKTNADQRTVHIRRPTLTRWPVYLCAFVGAVFAGAAFMSSPIGRKPAVQRVTTSVRVETVKIVHAAAALVHR